MANFYKMDPAVWDATTAILTLEEEAAYLRICNAIYKAERGCPDLPRVLAGMFRCSTRKASSLVEKLIEKGKIYRQDGGLWNDKAEREIHALNKKKDKKTAETPANQSRTGDERTTKRSRTDHEPGLNLTPIEDEPPDKPLKTNKRSNGNTPPRLDKTRQDESRKDSLEIAFEDFWKSYPRRRQDCGALTRGSKKGAFDQYKKLSLSDRKKALDGLAGFTRLYPDDSKAVCDAERYFSKQRWLDVDGIDETPQEFVPFPDGALGEKVKAFAELIGQAKYKAYFVQSGECAFIDCGDAVGIKTLGSFHANRLKDDFGAALTRVFGSGGVRFQLPEKQVA